MADDFGRQLADLLYGSNAAPEDKEEQRRIAQLLDRERLRRLGGAAETAATIGSGILSSVPAGLAGLASMLPTRGRAPDLNKAVERIEQVQQAGTYIPRGETGQRYLEKTAGALEALGAPAEYLGEKTFELTGSPGLATTVVTLGDPMNLAGLPGSGRAIAGAARTAVKAAKAAPRVAGEMVSDLVMPAPRAQAQRGAIVFHGSPHKFEAFDPTKIGTGEGAQAFGHGLYFAEAPGVASEYKRKLSDTLNIKGDATDLEKRAAQMALTFGDNTSEGAVKWLSKFEGKGAEHTSPALTPELVKSVKQKFSEGVFSPGGHLYIVDLPDEKIAQMLDWDKPLSQQPHVIKALKDTDYEVGVSQKEAEKIADQRLRQEAYEWADETGGDPIDYINNANWDKYVDQVKKESGKIDSDLTGKDLHKIIMRDEGYRPELFDSENYQIGTSELLRQLGIPGIKYLDRSSRQSGEGTRNFVVFPGEEKNLKIVDRKKEGGRVHISDNPDTMRLEMAVGGPVIGGALKYFGVPRLIGGLAERAMQARINSLIESGMPLDQIHGDAILNALALLPTKSGLEQSAEEIGRMTSAPQPFVDPSQEMMTGGYDWRPAEEGVVDAMSYYDPLSQNRSGMVSREIPVDLQGSTQLVSNTPMEDYLKYGGRDDDRGSDQDASYGQTSMPATEVRFDEQLIDPISGNPYTLGDESSNSAEDDGLFGGAIIDPSPKVQQQESASMFATGGAAKKRRKISFTDNLDTMRLAVQKRK